MILPVRRSRSALVPPQNRDGDGLSLDRQRRQGSIILHRYPRSSPPATTDKRTLNSPIWTFLEESSPQARSFIHQFTLTSRCFFFFFSRLGQHSRISFLTRPTFDSITVVLDSRLNLLLSTRSRSSFLLSTTAGRWKGFFFSLHWGTLSTSHARVSHSIA